MPYYLLRMKMKLIDRNHSLQTFFQAGNINTNAADITGHYSYFLMLLVLADLFFIYAGWSYPSQDFSSESFSITQEWGFGEMFQYAKELVIAIIFFVLFKKTRDQIFFVWGLFFAYLLLDDSLKIHETLGTIAASNLVSQDPQIFNLRTQDFGELIVSSLVGSVFLGAFIKFFYRSKQTIKTVTYNLIMLVFLLLFCGIIIDMVHSALPNVMGLNTLEDGGEMVVMSLICWYVLVVYKHYPRTIFSLINKYMIKHANNLYSHLYNLNNRSSPLSIRSKK